MPRLKRSDKGVGRRQKKHNFVRKGESLVQGISMQTCKQYRAFSSNFGKRPLAKIGEKMLDFLKLGKLGEINDIEHNKGSKIYSQNQIILVCIMPSIHLSTSV